MGISARVRRSVTLGTATLAGGLLLVGGSPVSTAGAEATTDVGPTMGFVATHEWAAAQPTAQGRIITELEVHEGQLWAGYGDYSANTGPITMASHDGTSGADFEAAFVVDSEAVYTIRSIGGDVIAPATDPRSAADFAVGDPWWEARPLGAAHVFDTATLNGSDLWMVGSKGNDAVAWRSLDGGQTWAESLRVSPDSVTGGFERFYFAGVLGDSLYVQSVNSKTGAASTARVFDGVSWSAASTMLPSGGFGAHPVQFGDRLIYDSQGHGRGGWLHSFDGSVATEHVWAYDFTVADGKAWILDRNGMVKSSTDLRNWSDVVQGPSDGRSLAVDGSSVYVGTASSDLWSAALSTGAASTTTTPTTVPDVGSSPTTEDDGTTDTVVEAPAVESEEPSVDTPSGEPAIDRRGRAVDFCPKGWAKKNRC